MPDYVYALHDFIPENEDEVSFRAGERIEVVEKDDQYGDGWWQVRATNNSLCIPQKFTFALHLGSEFTRQSWLISSQLFNPSRSSPSHYSLSFLPLLRHWPPNNEPPHRPRHKNGFEYTSRGIRVRWKSSTTRRSGNRNERLWDNSSDT